jgi:hypothetical protein
MVAKGWLRLSQEIHYGCLLGASRSVFYDIWEQLLLSHISKKRWLCSQKLVNPRNLKPYLNTVINEEKPVFTGFSSCYESNPFL